MNTHLIGTYWVLNALPIWITLLILLASVLWPIFILRDRGEGLFYNTSYSAIIGDGALLVVVLMAAGILQRGALPPGWAQDWKFHVLCGIAGIFLGWFWWLTDAFDKKRIEADYPMQWGDIYHHLVIVPLLFYLGLTLVPIICLAGTHLEKYSALSLFLLWAVLVIYDAKTKRLDQRNYHHLGTHLDCILEEIVWEVPSR